MDVGRSWSYIDKADGDTEFTIEVVGHETFQGASVAKFKRLDKNDEYDLISTEGALKLWLRHDDVNGSLDWSDDPVPFSQGLIVKIGDKYEAIPKSYTNPVTGGNFHWIIQIKRFRKISVPGGDFEHALQMNVKNVDTKSGLEVSKFDMYFARGVGLVMRAGRFITTTFKHLLTGNEG